MAKAFSQRVPASQLRFILIYGTIKGVFAGRPGATPIAFHEKRLDHKWWWFSPLTPKNGRFAFLLCLPPEAGTFGVAKAGVWKARAPEERGLT